MPTPDEVLAVVESYVSLGNSNDKDATIALFRKDAVWFDPVGAPPHVGHEGIGAFWDQSRSMAEKIELVPSNIIVCANEAAMIMEIHVTIGGSTMVMDCVETFEVDDDGLITNMKAYWDMSKARTRA
jgi:steroid delta-isomerase